MRLPLAPLTVPLLGTWLVASGCQKGSPDDASGPKTEPAVIAFADCQAGPVPGDAPLRLLTRRAYDNSVADILGDVGNASAAFPPENQLLGFNTSADAHQASPLLVSEMLSAAEGIAERTVATKLDQVAPCASGATMDCGAEFVREIGRKLFRRPLVAAEELVFLRLFTEALEQNSYANAISVALQAMLQAPQFLYRVESIRPPLVESGPQLLGPYEIATRLSYFLTESAPDDTLLEAAAQNALGTRDELEMQARRLLQLPHARSMVANFHAQWLGTEELGRVIREQAGVTPPANFGSLLQASLAGYMDAAFWEKGTFENLFSSDVIFLDAKLAPFFGHSAKEEGFSAVSEPTQRFGLLTQPALMVALAHPNQAAPVFRGVFLRQHFLCNEVPPPPPTVNAVAPDPDPKATTRERFRQHTDSPVCASCHTLIDPVGFGFENYDQFGRFRTEENGLPVDASGALNDLPETSLNGPFSGPAELAQRISQSTSARDCLATQWFRFAAGRAETAADRCSLRPLQAEFQASGALPEIPLKIALSDAFRYRPPYVQDGGVKP